MNSCMCSQCKGKKCHYSDYYHREEGFDTEHQNTVAYFQERVLALESYIRKLEKKLKKIKQA